MNEPGFLIVVQKLTSMSGESVQVSANLPKDATDADFDSTLGKIFGALDRRLLAQNEKVLALSEATQKAFEQALESPINGVSA